MVHTAIFLKTHKVGNKPQEILNRGYVRVTDKELEKYYPKAI